MKYNRSVQHRRSIRLPQYDYSQPGTYFITLVAHERECHFGEIENDKMRASPAGQIVRAVWETLSQRYLDINLGTAVVMPNHFHGIIHILETNVGAIHESPLREYCQLDSFQRDPSKKFRRKMTLPLVIGYFKMNSAKQINKLRNTPGNPVWQRNYYEHIVRSEEEYEMIEKYIQSNVDNWNQDIENISRQDGAFVDIQDAYG